MMRARVREDDGFLMLELLAAVLILSVAIMAIMAGYDSAFVSMHKAARNTAASTLAQNQLELYDAIYAGGYGYASVGLDTTTFSSVTASNATYTSDEAGLSDAANANPYTFACGSASQCLPVQTLTGSDGRSYTLETFIRDVSGVSYSGRTERVVTIIARDTTTNEKVAQLSAAFDAGPS